MDACNVIEHPYARHRVGQCLATGYLDASAMCAAVGQLLEPWLATRSTRQRLQAMAQREGVPTGCLVLRKVARGRVCCWLHPALARRLAAWLSPELATAVEQWLKGWDSAAAPLPVAPRYVVQPHRWGYRYFSFHNELLLQLLGPLAREGLHWPAERWPGEADETAFTVWLAGRGIAVHAFACYHHVPPSGPGFDARLYPQVVYPRLREYLHGEWLSRRLAPYFASLRPPRALPLSLWCLPEDLAQ